MMKLKFTCWSNFAFSEKMVEKIADEMLEC